MRPLTVYAIDNRGVRYELTDTFRFRETRPGLFLAAFKSAREAENAAWDSLLVKWNNDPEGVFIFIEQRIRDGLSRSAVRINLWNCLPSKSERQAERKVARRVSADLAKRIYL